MYYDIDLGGECRMAVKPFAVIKSSTSVVDDDVFAEAEPNWSILLLHFHMCVKFFSETDHELNISYLVEGFSSQQSWETVHYHSVTVNTLMILINSLEIITQI